MVQFYQSEINHWEYLGYFRIKNEEYYSIWLKNEIKRLGKLTQKIFKDGFTVRFINKYGVDFDFLKKLTQKLLTQKNIVIALYLAINRHPNDNYIVRIREELMKGEHHLKRVNAKALLKFPFLFSNICLNCNRDDFSSRQQYLIHMPVCRKELKCSYCGKTDFPSRASLNNHEPACGNKLNCSKCGETEFISLNGYYNHNEACGKKLNCYYCKKSGFTKKSRYNWHINNCRFNRKNLR